MATTLLESPARAAVVPPARQRRDPARLAFVGLLAATAVLYLWGLGASGWANAFYAAAAQAGSESWKAFLFGASDAAASITVDKTPLSLWPMALSIRLFGLNSWALLVPQALMGVASVALLTATVRRVTGSAWTGLLAGGVLALTPVAVLMFRFDNPDALLVLLLIGAVHATLRALESPHAVRWLALGGALVGLGYLTKMLQAFLVLPALAATYLLFAPAAVSVGRRLGHLLAAFGAMLLAGGWWVALVELLPASARPYIGGSQTNSILELTFGYNGLGRITGSETGSVGGGQGGGWGSTGLFRLLDGENGTQGGWLLPAALLLGVAVLVLSTPAVARVTGFPGLPRRAHAGLVAWTGWLVVTWLTFSLMAGIFHPYYSVALAPAIAAVVAIGAGWLWRHRSHPIGSSLLAATVALSSVWAFVLLGRVDWHPWLRYVVLLAGLAGALGIGLNALLPGRAVRWVAVLALAGTLLGPASYSLATASTPHTGSIPSAGPSVAGTGFGPGGRGGTPPAGFTPPGTMQGTTSQGTTTQGPTGARAQARAGGLLDASTPSTAVTTTLLQDADSYTWVAAAVGSQNASGYQLATGRSVMPIGGFNGSDPSPTLAQFESLVAQHRIHWFIAGGGMGGPGGGPGGAGTSSEITSWVESHFTATTVGGVTLYDLSGGVA